MSADPEFATLLDVAVRDAWAHEAHRFTPWLAANLDRLSAVLGVPLELVETEMRVGPFSADILAGMRPTAPRCSSRTSWRDPTTRISVRS